MTKNIELRLIDAPVPDGEIAVKDLAALTTALQELMTRIGRDVVHTPGPGRTKHFMEEFAQLRLRGIREGSTVLQFSKGSAEQLDVDVPEQAEAEERFWKLVKAISEDRRPTWVTDLIAESAGRFVDALQAAAPKAVVSAASNAGVEIESNRIHADTWTSKRLHTGTVMSARGRLEKVDLRTNEFRVRDDVGQAVELKHVEHADSAARLVGTWVEARGIGVIRPSGQLLALDGAVIEPVHDPAAEHLHGGVQSVDEILAGTPGPDSGGGLDLTDDEFAAFIEAARS